jgi:hypothetical protein
MIQLLKSLFGEGARENPAKNRAPQARARSGHTTHAGVDYRAVSLAPSLECYAAAKNCPGTRYLLRDAPRLPLANCATPANCTCKFRKHADRRDGDRRLLGEIETNRWYAGAERRLRGGRRGLN